MAKAKKTKRKKAKARRARPSGPKVKVVIGHVLDALRALPERSVHAVVTSPPYWRLRSYLPDDSPLKEFEYGSEDSPEEWCANQVAVFEEVWRVLRDDGMVWLNVGDSYASGPPGNRPNTSKDSSGLNNSRENLEMRRSAYRRRRFRAQEKGSKQERNKGSDRDGCPVVVGYKPGDRICQAHMLGGCGL